ncbi:NADPH-dependent oxidoreductase [Pseudomonas sp. dw_612]|uniref:NADPH-dependent oxidoreductase n=1 Tax=Pseudomonas sp. dw_612 TaxID=2720080 RepID=UPI001BD41C54|nr:NADPH-dependent oxidoreductase [Pseudomonas sp. dw_612]
MSSSLNSRYRHGEWPQGAPWNDIIESLLQHTSVRSYLDKPLPEGTLHTLVAAAQSAATSSNLQAWSLLAIEDPARKARLAELAGNQAHIRQAPLFLVWLADLSRIDRQAQRQDIELGAPAYLDSLLVSSIDAALAAQNAVVALESLGLGSVYIGALRNNLAAVIDELQLPPLVFPVFGLCVGYADPTRPAAVKPRLPQQVVLHRETYGQPVEQQLVDDYDQHIAAFYREQGLSTPSWSQQAVERLRSIHTLNGREHISAVLKGQRFEQK